MKQLELELELKERLLIVELPEDYTFNTYADKLTICNEINKPVALIRGKWELICKGSELTEEVAEGFVEESKYMNQDSESGWIDYKVYPDGLILNPLESFISAIEAQGYYWGENTIKEPIENDYNLGDIHSGFFHKKYNEWQEAESKTFNLSKTLIFEIL